MDNTNNNNTDIECCILYDAECIQIEFEIPGEPVAQIRPRIANRQMFNPQIYNPQSTIIKKLRQNLKQSLEDVGHHAFPVFSQERKVSLAVTFNLFKNNKDLDNMLKFYMDVLHDIIYVNDLQVYAVSMKKKVKPHNIGTTLHVIYRK